ncbi:MAG: thioredoxin domain-containing protein [Herbiconiux sp.]|nr:thioredoxin domain-containing protein [Herbiconiux sp.]
MSPAKSDKSMYEGLPKKDRQALAREVARIQREEEQRRRRRNRIVATVTAVVVGAGILTGVGFAVYNGIRNTFVGPLNMISDGIVFSGDGSTVTATTTAALQPGASPVPTELDESTVLRIAEYVDYASPDVATFETANGAALQGYVTAGYASIELHPVALEGADSYAARAANTVACVANTVPDAVLAIHNSLVAAQATLPEGGLSNDELVTLVKDAGLDDPTVASCITGNEFSDWVGDATARAQAEVPNSDVTALTTVPLVIMDGTAYTGALDDTDALNTFITDVFAASSTPPEGTDGASGTEAPADGTAPTEAPAPETPVQ